jgi:hypothetical protein
MDPYIYIGDNAMHCMRKWSGNDYDLKDDNSAIHVMMKKIFL